MILLSFVLRLQLQDQEKMEYNVIIWIGNQEQQPIAVQAIFKDVQHVDNATDSILQIQMLQMIRTITTQFYVIYVADGFIQVNK